MIEIKCVGEENLHCIHHNPNDKGCLFSGDCESQEFDILQSLINGRDNFERLYKESEVGSLERTYLMGQYDARKEIIGILKRFNVLNENVRDVIE